MLSMAYDEQLLIRIRRVLNDRHDVIEQKMFGGVVFMVGGRMTCGPHGDRLIVRIGEHAAREHIGEPHVLPMDFTGRVMKNFAMIEPEGMRTAAQLQRWVQMSVAYAESHGPKVEKAKPRRSRPVPKPRRGL